MCGRKTKRKNDSVCHHLTQITRLTGTLLDWRCVLAPHYARLGHNSRQRRFMANLPDRTVRMIAVSPAHC